MTEEVKLVIQSARVWRIGESEKYEGSCVVTIPKKYIDTGAVDPERPVKLTIEQEIKT